MEDNSVKGKSLGYISAALGLVAGLAWNDAIKALIEEVIPLGNGTILLKFVYAVVVTIVIALAIKYLDKLANRK